MFSLFQEHTEWICKGKAGVPQGLRVRAAVVEDQYRFILHHRVMYRETDEKVTAALVERTKALYPEVRSCSFDKGFYAPQHQGRLEELIDLVVLPKKGCAHKQIKYMKGTVSFSRSADVIAGLRQQSMGLSFKGWAGVLITGNLHTLGNLLLQREQVHQKTAG